MTLAELEARMKVVEQKIAAMGAAAAGQLHGASAASVDLDSEHGNFHIQKMPPRWTGEDYTGRRLSETSADFLDALASFREWQAEQDASSGDAKKLANLKWKILDAARARGWSERLRRQGLTVKTSTATQEPVSDEIPF